MKNLSILLSLWISILTIACGDKDDAADAGPADARPAGGTISLTWAIKNGEDVLSCEDVGAVAVSLIVIPSGGQVGEVDPFTCTAGTATSRGFVPGMYDVEIDLRASGSRSLVDTTLRVEDVEVVLNQNTSLGELVFEVEPSGSLTFQLSAGQTGDNCISVESGGAGMTDGSRFELKDRNGNCVPTTFEVGTGNGASGSYETDCPSTVTFGCIEKSQVITVDPATSGPYTLEVHGIKPGGLECYHGASQFTIPGNGWEQSIGTVTMALEYSADCDPDYVEPDAGPDGGADAGPIDGG